MADENRPIAASAPPTHKPGQHDLTSGPIASTLLMFALPTLGSNILHSLNASINAIWIGRFLGESALAATSNANNIIFLCFGGVFGFGMAATILIGQHIGRGDTHGARKAIGAAMGLFFALSIVIMVAGLVFVKPLLHLLATPPEALPQAQAYLAVMFLSIPANFALVLLMMGLRGAGDSMTPLWFMLLSAGLDAGLNPLFILGVGPFPELGIAGSATASTIANYTAVIGLLSYIYVRDLPIRLRGAELLYLFPPLPLLRLILSKGIVMGLQMIMLSVSGLAMMGLVNRAGVVTTAAYGVALQLWTYIQMPAIAMGTAVSAMAAQNIGAGRWDRVDQVTRQGVIFSVMITATALTLLNVFDEAALSLFLGGNSPSVPIAAHIQNLAGWGFVASGIMMVLTGVIRANGAVLGPLLLMTIAFMPGRIGFALLMDDYLGVDALWWSYPFASVLAMFFSVLYYRYANWRRGALADVAEQIEHGEVPHAIT